MCPVLDCPNRGSLLHVQARVLIVGGKSDHYCTHERWNEDEASRNQVDELPGSPRSDVRESAWLDLRDKCR